MKKSLLIFTLFILSILLNGCGEESYEVLDEVSESSIPEASAAQTEQIGVYVCGEVMRPGIYYFESSARVEDAIIAAGGMTANACIDAINPAEYLNDCDKVYVPAFGEVVEDNNTVENDGRIDLNRAALEELMTLPGIGQSKAQSIIDYRNENGAYTSIEDIMNITGIKEGVFNKIKDLIKV